MPSESEIAQFWSWFQRVAAFLEKNVMNEKMHDELDERLRALGVQSWEIGPGEIRRQQLALSPVDTAGLERTRTIVAQAPAIAGWELHAAKPPKKWDMQLTMHVDDRRIDVDARTWKYVLLEYEDGVFDLLFEDSSAIALGEHAQLAAELVAESILGEEVRLERIASVELTAELDGVEADDLGPIAHLAAHVAQLMS